MQEMDGAPVYVCGQYSFPATDFCFKWPFGDSGWFFFKKQQVISAVDEVADPLMDLVNDLGELVKAFPPDLRGQWFGEADQ